MNPEIFDTSFYYEDRKHTRARRGMTWTTDELNHLDEMYLAGCDLRAMTTALERPVDGVMAKLAHLGRCVYSGTGRIYYHAKPNSRTNTTEETTMEKNAPIETKTFIFGADAANMTDAQIFTQIGKIEREIATLDQIQHKPKKLSARIEELRADVVKLAEYVDAR